MADERFSGDMSRNEVEMDLSKFMEMIQENAALKDEIRDLKANDTVNTWQKWVQLITIRVLSSEEKFYHKS